jgi:tRNA(fMet)-specific endonuclease VapC
LRILDAENTAMYLLDTSTCSYAVMGHPGVFTRLDSLDRDLWVISSLVYAELQFGLEKAKLRPRSREALAKFLASAAVVSFDRAAALEAARVRAELEALGTPAGAIDQLIAGHARALGAILVSANTRHFLQIPGLALENWWDGV